MMGSGEATLLFAGDAMMHQAQIEAARLCGVNSCYDYSDCFVKIRPLIESADYSVVNLETPLGKNNFTGYPCFNSPVSYATALKEAGFDMFLTANNHTLDRHDSGLVYTINILDSLGISHIGTYVDAAARDSIIPYIVDVKGFRIGFLNYTYGTNGITSRTDVEIDYIDNDKIRNDISKTREAGAEIVVACMHWGVEYVLSPVSSQKQLADYLVSLGADLVIGGHPHVVEPYEMRHSDVTGRPVAVTYSLGNFISNMRTRDTRGGALALVKLKRDSVGEAYVNDCRYEYIFTVPPSGNRKNFMVYPVDSVPEAWQPAAKAFLRALK